jgi:hypothetical protein
VNIDILHSTFNLFNNITYTINIIEYKGEIRMNRRISLFEKVFTEFKLNPQNNNFSRAFKNLGFPTLRLKPIQMNSANINIPDQIQKVFKNLTTSISRITKASPKDDYEEIVNGFLPQNATLITPKRPSQAGAIRFADIDGDLEKELIASYILNNETTTFILKKQNERWQKIYEIYEPKHNDINYMGFADITGEGRKQLLVGRKGSEATNVLDGYNFNNGKFTKMFSRNYNRIEVVKPGSTRDASSKNHIALWNKNNTSAYDIEVMDWNGKDLEAVSDNSSYYANKVLPFYGQRVKQMPKNPAHWYYLADSLVKSDMHQDALSAIEYGLRLNPVSPSKDEFLALKAKIRDKMKK